MTPHRRLIVRVGAMLTLLLTTPLSSVSAAPPLGGLDSLMVKAGLVDVGALDRRYITVDLRYATAHNFVGRPMYRTLTRAYATRATAVALLRALQLLRNINPAYGLIIYDAARPLSAQRTMWQMVVGTRQQRYVANPTGGGGPHNYGIAVDLALTLHGKPVDMGTPFDTFTPDAHITDEPTLVRSGRISPLAAYHRRQLRRAMVAAGFSTYSREWWHFTSCSMPQARARYRLLDF